MSNKGTVTKFLDDNKELDDINRAAFDAGITGTDRHPEDKAFSDTNNLISSEPKDNGQSELTDRNIKGMQG